MDPSFVIRLIKEGESERIEFKRKATKDIHKEICALANANGGYILIGVDDRGNITGCDVRKAMEIVTSSSQAIVPPPKISTHRVNLGGKDILVVEVGKSDVLCSVGGVAYVRVGAGIRPLSIQEIVMLSVELGTVSWDGVPSLPLEEAREEYIRWFFGAMERARGRKIPEDMWMRYLRSVGAVKEDKLTNAGVLFFTDASEFLNHCRCRIIFVGEEPKASKEYEGPVWRIIDDVMVDLTREVRRTEVVVGARRVRIEEYPVRALREALINAFAHRNYTIPSDVKVFVYPDKIVVRSPGGLMPGVDLSDPEHVPRNPNLCNLLYDSGYIEKYGRGIVMMREECEKHPLVDLEFRTGSNKFEVIFRKNADEILDEVDRKILHLLVTPMRSSDISEAVGLSKPSVLERLKKMEALGLVRKIGRGPKIRYVSSIHPPPP